MSSRDTIHLQGLSVSTHIGVPHDERQTLQHLTINVTLWPKKLLSGLEDQFERTLDYAEVAQRLRTVAAVRPRQLIETLAEDLIHSLLQHYPLDQVRLEVQKFILPGTDYVSVCLTRPCLPPS